MKKKKKLSDKNKVLILEQLATAQAELILIQDETISTVDFSDIAIASVHDPDDEGMIGKNLHEVRKQHIDREEELVSEIEQLYKQLDLDDEDEEQGD